MEKLRHEPSITDDEWALLAPHLVQAGDRGRPTVNARDVYLGVEWKVFNGKPWRQVPPVYGKWDTVFRYWKKWTLHPPIWWTVLSDIADRAENDEDYAPASLSWEYSHRAICWSAIWKGEALPNLETSLIRRLILLYEQSIPRIAAVRQPVDKFSTFVCNTSKDGSERMRIFDPDTAQLRGRPSDMGFVFSR